jgi:hypothetical protein
VDGQQLIGAYAKAPIAELLGDACQIRDVLFQAIDKNKIIARTMHLGKFQFHRFNLE